MTKKRPKRPLILQHPIQLGNLGKQIVYTCLDVSKSFLICGYVRCTHSCCQHLTFNPSSTNTGSVYLYARTLKPSNSNAVNELDIRVQCGYFTMIKMVAPPMNIRQSVASVRICPRERFLAVGTTQGVLYALSLVDPKKGTEKTEFSHDFHGGSTVSCLLWAPTGKRLFSACTSGVVAVTRLRMGVSAFFGSADTEMLLREETGIVQLDYTNDGHGQELLLVSSQTRVLILSLNADVASVVQIGSKLRQGTFGGCFFQGKV